jgi:transposase
MQPYPQELRVRVVAAVEQGEHSIPEIASLFNVGVTFIKKMLRLHRAGDDLAPRHGGGAQPALKEPEHKVLREHMAAQPDASLAELQQVLVEQCAVCVSQATICRALQELDLPRKKDPFRPGTRRKTAQAVPPLN